MQQSTQSTAHDPTKRILVVEDDPDLAETIAEVLENDGYDVSIAVHGLDAIQQLQGGAHPDLILLDLMMPVMDGWEFRDAQTELPEAKGIPVVALTADGDAHGKAERLHAAGALAKPIAIEPLLAEIARVCGRE